MTIRQLFAAKNSARLVWCVLDRGHIIERFTTEQSARQWLRFLEGV